MTLSVTHQGSVSLITLHRPPMNLLNLEVIDELIELHQQADRHPETRVIVTRSAIPQMFCNGLDPLVVLQADQEGRAAIFRGIGRLLRDLLALTKPHIAVLNGPAMAGGAILALTADFRLIDAHHGRLCFSECKVGLPIPTPVAQTIAHFCRAGSLGEVVLLGKNMDAATTCQLGLANECCASEQMEEVLSAWVSRLDRLSPAVLAASKRALRGHLLTGAGQLAEDPAEFAQFLDDDFVGRGLRALVEGTKPQFPR